MLTINTILKEIKNVPANRLEELYQFIHSMDPHKRELESMRKKILSYGGAFSDMSEDDYADFVQETKRTRKTLFTRNSDL